MSRTTNFKGSVQALVWLGRWAWWIACLISTAYAVYIVAGMPT